MRKLTAPVAVMLLDAFVALAAAALLLLGGCAGKTVNGLTAAEISTQAAGVAAALESLPKAPADVKTQETVAGYAAWAAFLAGATAAVAGAAVAGAAVK